MPTITLKNLPDALHETLKQRAQQHGRSLNREVIACLEGAVAVSRIDANESLSGIDRIRSSDHVRLDSSLLRKALKSGRP